MKKLILIPVLLIAIMGIWYISKINVLNNVEQVIPTTLPNTTPTPGPEPTPTTTPTPTPTPTPIPSLTKSGVKGTVTISPTCPVEQYPPQPGCDPKGYATNIAIRKAGSSTILKTISSNSSGEFSTTLAPGSYVLKAKGGNVMPTCPEISVEIKAGMYTEAPISCDSGIR